jgi:TolB-like protein
MQQRKHAGALLGKIAADIRFKSIAVLPFANLSEYRQNAYLADANTIFVIALCRAKEHNPSRKLLEYHS